MEDSQILDTIANLILQNITVWEERHVFARTFSSEYSAFWALLDDGVRVEAARRRKMNVDARLLPFSIGNMRYFKGLLTKENFVRLRGLYWNEQLKIILGDGRFRTVLNAVVLELDDCRDGVYGYNESRAAVSG